MIVTLLLLLLLFGTPIGWLLLWCAYWLFVRFIMLLMILGYAGILCAFIYFVVTL